jgi:hypothetical protein
VDVYIGDAETEVRPVDTEAMPSAEAQDRIVDATVARLSERESAADRVRDETQLWHSVRAGTGR